MIRGNKNNWSQRNIAMMLLLLVVLLPLASAISYPQLTGYVTDNANIIDSGYEQKITDLADKINKETTVEIAVLTIQSLEGDTPENYALQTFRQNGVGKKDNNNGLLILVAKDERKYKFEVGYGLEGTVPDAMKVPIGDKIITPNFRNGEYGKGIYESMLVIEGLVTNNTEVLSKYGLINQNVGGGGSGEADTGGIFIILIFGIIGLIILLFLITRTDNIRRYGRETYSPPSIPTTYKQTPYTRSSGSSRSSSSSNSSSSSSSSISRRRSSYSSGSHSHSSGHFGGGFGGGRSGGGGFGGGW